MHPFIGAYLKYRRCVDLAIRPWSPYFSTWIKMCEERRDIMEELRPPRVLPECFTEC